jgi:hypothetical protein
MKLFSKSILYAVVLSLFAACSSPDRSQELATVDSLQNIAANYSDSMQLSIFDSVAIITEETKTKSDFLLETYRDSTDREFWVDNFSDYARLYKKSDEYQEDLKELREAWELSITQLDDLKMDISNNAIDFEKAALYIGKEADAIEVQKHEFKTLKGRVNNYISVYHRTRDVIEDRLARLNGEQEEENL